MILDVDKCAKDYTEKLTDLTEEQKQSFTEMATAMGNFLNCIWAQKESRGDKSGSEGSDGCVVTARCGFQYIPQPHL